MEKLINFYNENAQLFQLLGLVIVWFFTHRSVAIGYAKKKASTLIFAAEKYSETLLLSYGKEKMDFVVSEGYKLLPSMVRVFISMDTFRNEAQKLFDFAKSVADSKAKDIAVPNVTVTPVIAPVEPQITQP